MTLPPPTSSFTIPSIHDDIDLECRIYHPKPSRPKRAASKTEKIEKTCKKGAVFAHPYAPLGGSFDDPVIHAAASAVLDEGFVVGTFNFRGAGHSKGRTSWTAKPERDDMASFVGFMATYMQHLDAELLLPTSAHRSYVHSYPNSPMSPNFRSPDGNRLTPIISATANGAGMTDEPLPMSPTEEAVLHPIDSKSHTKTKLLVAGYSYGSLVLSSLPPIKSILSSLDASSAPGKPATEIRLRAEHMAAAWNVEAEEALREKERGRRQGSSGTIFGGEEGEPGSRRTSREGRRSGEIVRKSIEGVRRKLKHRKSEDASAKGDGPGNSSQAEHGGQDADELEIYYLLISPLAPPVSSFLTLFSSPHVSLPHSKLGHKSAAPSKHKGDDKLAQNPTLAIYGNNDIFSPIGKTRKWALGLENSEGSLFHHKEIDRADHFWREDGVEERMRNEVRSWVKETIV